jgi:hypothetical protein
MTFRNSLAGNEQVFYFSSVSTDVPGLAFVAECGLMRSMTGTGQWTDETGAMRNASLTIELDGARACVTVAAINADAGERLPTGDRRIAHFLGRVEQTIRRTEYVNRSITPDPKPKDNQQKQRRRDHS